MVNRETIREALQGESKNVELKETLPENSEKYTKTAVAFANTQGGTLVFGVTDEKREIVGIDEAVLFQTMDSIANAISDSCEPQIIPDIEPYTIEGKTVIMVTVSPGFMRPYYLKSKGKEKGTYIRVGATTRPASPEKIKELEMEGAKVSWDELICIGYEVTEDAVETLCHDMNARRREMQERKETMEKLPAVTRTNLVNWKVLKETSDGYLASNAFVLLTSDCFPFSKTQCAVFKGTDRSVFLDKREYSGPIYTQVENAVRFVLRNIRIEVKIDGLIRKESYELPVDAIREIIVNAHCHRNLTDESCVQVAVYDDRLEVSSPGGLYNGLTFEEAMQGHSKLRNRVIANVFSQIGFVEAWGTGLRRILNAAKEYNLPEPEFVEMPESFRVNLYRSPLPTQNIGETSEKHRKNIGQTSEKCQPSDETVLPEPETEMVLLSEAENKSVSRMIGILCRELSDKEMNRMFPIVEYLKSHDKIDAQTMRQITGKAKTTVSRYINRLIELDVLEREGDSVSVIYKRK